MQLIDKDTKFIAWSSWLLVTIYFAYQLILRVPLGLIMNDIMHKFNVDAGDYGALSSMYYLGYAGMQIPLALFLDKYGPRKVVSLCALACATASILFIYTTNWNVLLFCRFIIGSVSAAGFLGASKVIATSFTSQSYGKMIGATFSLGLMGAVFGGKPMGLLMDKFGWNEVMLWTGGVGVFLSLIIVLIVRDTAPIETEEEKVFDKIKETVKNPKIILMVCANFLMVGTLEGFADVWGVQYFMKALSISRSDAAYFTSAIFIGTIFGGFVLAHIADKYNKHHFLTTLCGIGIAAIFYFIIFMPLSIPLYALYFLMFMLGIFSCYQVLVFTLGSIIVRQPIVSVTVAVLNMSNTLGGAFFHTSIGEILDYYWDGSQKGQIKLYSLEAYKNALLVIPTSALIGGIIFLILMCLYIIQKKRKKLLKRKTKSPQIGVY